MKSKVFIISILSFILFHFPIFGQSVISQKASESVISAIKSGNVAILTQYLNDPLDLTVPGSDDNFSRTQAGQILKKFFKDHPVKSFVVHQSGKSVDGSLFVIGRYESTDGKKYRIYYLIKEFSGKGLVYLLEIEQE